MWVAPDPYGLHAERFFYAENRPGRLVRNANRVESYDDVPAGTPFAPPGYTVPPPPIVRTVVAPAPSLPAPAPALFNPPPPPEAEPHKNPVGELPGGAEPPRGLAPDARRARPIACTSLTSRCHGASGSPARLSRNSRPEWLPRTAWLVVGVVALVIVGSVLIIILPSGSDHSPAQATTNPQLVVPGGFLNGGRGFGATTTTTNQSTTPSAAAASATAQSWTTNTSYASSSMSLAGVACPSATHATRLARAPSSPP